MVSEKEAIKEIRERRAKIGSGRWRYVVSDNLIEMEFGAKLFDFAIPRSLAVSEEQRNANGFFAAHAPTDIDTLLAALDVTQAQYDVVIEACAKIAETWLDNRKANSWTSTQTSNGIAEAIRNQGEK